MPFVPTRVRPPRRSKCHIVANVKLACAEMELGPFWPLRRLSRAAAVLCGCTAKGCVLVTRAQSSQCSLQQCVLTQKVF